MTQKEIVLAALREGPLCSFQFYDRAGITHRLGARIYDLKRDGHHIISRRCESHRHNANAVEYVLVEVDQMRLALQ